MTVLATFTVQKCDAFIEIICSLKIVQINKIIINGWNQGLNVSWRKWSKEWCSVYSTFWTFLKPIHMHNKTMKFGGTNNLSCVYMAFCICSNKLSRFIIIIIFEMMILVQSLMIFLWCFNPVLQCVFFFIICLHDAF
jgi:hypothetical protein